MIEDYRKARLNAEHRAGALPKHLPLLLTVKNLSETPQRLGTGCGLSFWVLYL